MTASDRSGFATQFAFSEDVAATDWLRKRVVTGGVGWSMIPAGFDAYVQVLHPALGSDRSEVWTILRRRARRRGIGRGQRCRARCSGAQSCGSPIGSICFSELRLSGVLRMHEVLAC
jgi:hypothetical protein